MDGVARQDGEPQVRTLRAASRQLRGATCSVQTRSFSYIVDEPVRMGGIDAAPTPMEYMLGGLATCLLITTDLVCREWGVALQSLSLDLEGDIDLRGLLGKAPVRPDFSGVRGVLQLTADLGDGRLAQLRAEVERRSPAFALFQHAGTLPAISWHLSAQAAELAADVR